MRARLHPAWPALTEVFGLRPDDVPRFSAEEWNRYIERLDDIAADAQASRGA